jgi:CcmD family protein
MKQENQTAPAASESPRPATTFEAVQGGPQTKDGATLMVEAYAAIWTILMVWLLFMWRKQASLNARLDGLERAIDRAAQKAETAGTGTK